MEVKIYNNYVLCLVLNKGETHSTIIQLDRAGLGGYKLNYSSYVENSKLKDLKCLDKIRQEIILNCENEVNKLKSNLVSTNASDYTDEYNRDIMNLKKRIKTLAYRLSECDIEFEDERFVNLLHEIYQSKKQLGSFANEYTSDARKKNGTIKYKIKQEEHDRDKKLALLDLDLMKKVIENRQ